MPDHASVYFIEAMALLREGYFLDAVELFHRLLQEYSDHELADDAGYNIGRCYYELNQFERAASMLISVIQQYPDAQISVLSEADEHGRTAAKAYYLLVHCHLAQGQVAKAEAAAEKLKGYDDSFVMSVGVKQTYAQLARRALNVYRAIREQAACVN